MKTYVHRAIALLTSFLGAVFIATPVIAAPPFSVAVPEPSTTFINATTEISAEYTNDVESVNHCNLFINGSDEGAMTLNGNASGGTATANFVFTSTGSHDVRVTCYNTDESTSVWGDNTITVFNDSAAPSISNLRPGTATAGTAVNIEAEYNDTDFGSGIESCGLIVDDSESGLMSLSGGVGSTAGTASISYAFSTAGSHEVKVNCFDRSGNLGSETISLMVAASTDTTPPTVSMVDQNSTNVNVSLQHTATFSDAGGVASCRLFIDGTDVGAMSLTGTQAARNYTYTTTGSHTAYVRCTDNAGNSAAGPSKTITVSTVSDGIAPTVSPIAPITAIQNVPQTYTVTASDNGTVASCSIHIELGGTFHDFPMQWDSRGSAGSATYTWTFHADTAPTRDYNMYASCTDSSGNIGTGETTVVDLSAQTSATLPYDFRLVKLACPSGADVNHPCKAVYYVDSTGTRHAFPNEKVYFSWYTNFNNVAEVNASTLGSMPLGSNVNYRPGMRMVKFTTLNNVYAVGRNGELRWVTSESVAASLYGPNWNTKIDDISDAFYTDYSFGADISTASSFNPGTEITAVTTIEANIR